VTRGNPVKAKVDQTRRGNVEILLSDLRLVVVLAMALLLALTMVKLMLLKWRGIQKETRFA